MDLYQSQGKSIPQRSMLVLIQTVFVAISGFLLIHGQSILSSWFGWKWVQANGQRDIVLFVLFLIVYVRITFMVFYLLKRSITWSEAFIVPLAFAIYYIGFSLFSLSSLSSLSGWDWLYIVLFLIGSWLNTFSEWLRHQWIRSSTNKGKLYTKGLFHYSMHINYFGDVLWVAALALLSGNAWSLLIPAMLICMFVFYNIPMLDRHLEEKYGKDFIAYRKKTKKLIPFIY